MNDSCTLAVSSLSFHPTGHPSDTCSIHRGAWGRNGVPANTACACMCKERHYGFLLSQQHQRLWKQRYNCIQTRKKVKPPVRAHETGY